MGVSGSIRERVELNKGLIFKCFEDVLMGLETKEKELKAVQNSLSESSKELNFLRESVEEGQNQYGREEEMLKQFQLIRDMFRDLESKKKEMCLVLEDIKVREEKLNLQEKLIEALFEKIELNIQEFLDERFAEISRKEKHVEEKSERCRLENELREKVMACREEELVAKEKELEATREKDLASFLAREKQLLGREIALNSRKEELAAQEKELEATKEQILASFVAEEKQLEAREKVLESRKDQLVAKEKQLELRERILDLQAREKNGALAEPGRPNHGVSAGNQVSESNPVNGIYGEGSQPKRKRGRPRKNPVDRQEITKPSDGFRTIVSNRISEPYPTEGYFPQTWPKRKRGRSRKHHVEREEISKPSNDIRTVAGNTYLEPNPARSSYLIPQIQKGPVPRFYDFEQDRLECFPSETWACYDEVDGMPRNYVRIWQKRFCQLKVGILKFHRKYQKIDWTETDLPAGCGRFMADGSEIIMDHRIFSHQIACEYCPSGGYWIYPRKGEIWALFLDRDTGRCSDSASSKQFKYEIVEVLSDFVESSSPSIRVAYLEKLSPSLWRQTENSSFFIWPSELFRFSHRIPSYQLDGTEKGDIPKGSFELDPAALPTNLC